jgi:hypothetical protein
MTISMYAASVPVVKQMLGSLSAVLAKAEAHAAAHKINPEVLVQTRLFPDMLPLAKQVQIACDFSKGLCARLAAVDAPKFEDNELTLADLQERIRKTLDFVATIKPEQINGTEERDITFSFGTNTREFKGMPYLLHYAMPQIVFHVTTAYAILRSNGVALGKGDFIGSF